ncbi:MAG TPA: hydrogenase nickel incorporation protein HypB [Nocardioidaceae bacterium]|nr:hydrogenase nickel incorporation protein HypB [Nocardioidaceae bacterium]
MCATCGCGQDEVRISSASDEGGTTYSLIDGHPDHAHDHHHDHAHGQEHGHDHHPHSHADADGHRHARADGRTTLDIEEAVLARNDHLAEHNRTWLQHNGIRAVNLMSSPGAGKTSLLERTIREHDGEICVIEGDQETQFDADRIRDAGARAVQVNTGAGCHLDATMVRHALDQLVPDPGALVFVENVGNLVCPAMFDLGEDRRVVIISVTEGDDKPLKYPHMFTAADLVVVNKIDLLPYVAFDLARCESDARKLNPRLEMIPLSVTSGENLAAWYAWLGDL